MRPIQSIVMLATFTLPALAGAAPAGRTAKLEATFVGEAYEAVGTVRSRTRSVLSSRIVGAITAVPVQEGDRVKPGQLLMEIDDRDVQAQLQKSRAGLREVQDALIEVSQGVRGASAAHAAATANRELAEATFRRYDALRQSQSVSPQEFDEVQARFKGAVAEETRAAEMIESLESKKRQVLSRIEQAKADVASAENYAGYARIQAPLAGVVTIKHADVGTMASPGVPLLTVEDDLHYRFEAQIEESRVGQIRLDDPAEVRIDALPEQVFDGKVAEIVPTSDPSSRSIVVKLDLVLKSGGADSRAQLRSGFFGRARFTIGQRQILAVPQQALVRRGQLVGVFVVDADRTARLRLIKSGREQGGNVEVLSGLAGGETILVEGADTFTDGMRVEGQEGEKP